MSLMRRLLLSAPVAALFFGGMAFGQVPMVEIEKKKSETLPAAFTSPLMDEKAATTTSSAPCGTIVVGTQGGCGAPVCLACDAGCGPRAGVFGDWLYLKARNSDVPYAIPVDELTLSLPAGHVAQVDQQYANAFRFGVWYAPVPEVVIRAAYTQFDNFQGHSTFAPEGTILQSLVTHPNSQNAAFDSLAAQAGHDIEMRLIDIDGTYRIWGGNCSAVNVNALGGVRYARLEQAFGSLFLLEGEQVVATNANFEGIGPRMGLEGDVMFTRGLYGYGSGVVSLLVGRQNADYLQVDVFQGVLANTGYDKDRIVPVVDLEFGVGMTCCRDHVNLRLGYMISSWYNIVTTNGLIQSVQQGDFTTNRDNIRDRLTFDGFVARVEFRW